MYYTSISFVSSIYKSLTLLEKLISNNLIEKEAVIGLFDRNSLKLQEAYSNAASGLLNELYFS